MESAMNKQTKHWLQRGPFLEATIDVGCCITENGTRT